LKAFSPPATSISPRIPYNIDVFPLPSLQKEKQYFVELQKQNISSKMKFTLRRTQQTLLYAPEDSFD